MESTDVRRRYAFLRLSEAALAVLGLGLAVWLMFSLGLRKGPVLGLPAETLLVAAAFALAGAYALAEVFLWHLKLRLLDDLTDRPCGDGLEILVDVAHRRLTYGSPSLLDRDMAMLERLETFLRALDPANGPARSKALARLGSIVERLYGLPGLADGRVRRAVLAIVGFLYVAGEPRSLATLRRLSDDSPRREAQRDVVAELRRWEQGKRT